MRQQRTNEAYSYLFFLIWPLLGLFNSFRFYKEKWAKNVVWLFVVFYGYNFVIPNQGADANRYIEKFVSIHNSEISSNNFTGYFFDKETNTVDILEPSLSFLISRVTDNPKILFAAYGLIFGFFYSRNLFFVLNYLKRKPSLKVIGILLLFAFSVGIWEINGVRFWTAAHMFFYGIYPFITERKKSNLIFVFLCPLMHFSFFFLIIIFLIYYIVGNKMKLYFILFLASFLISEINIEAVRNLLTTYLPDIFAIKVNAYTSEAYIEVIENREQTIFKIFIKYAEIILKFFIVVFVFYKRKLIMNDPLLVNFFCFVLLFFSVSNILSLMPSGNRFLIIVSLFLYGYLFIYLQKVINNKLLNRFLLLYTPLIFIIIVYNLRIIAVDTFHIFTFISNPLFLMFLN